MQWFKDEDGDIIYFSVARMPSGQTVLVQFQETKDKNKNYYNIYFTISTKRKYQHDNCLQTTGKDGLKGLLWAKKQIKLFEIFIKDRYPNLPIIIYCYWDDNRRRNIYERGLKDIGYTFNYHFGYKCLSKTLV